MKRFLIALVILVAVLVAFVATRPPRFHVERTATIAAPAEVIFPHLNDFHAWTAWSPWEKLDPNMVRTYGGAESGAGATYHWVGNDKVGEGNMTITESDPSRDLEIRLEFLKPWKATNTAKFVLAPAAGGTQVTWSIDGNHDFAGKAMSLMMDMDKMLGGDFEKGLAELKTVAEAEAVAVPAVVDSATTPRP
jgi:Polyketide cyclase / dehydrase and lipid transport